MKNLIPAVFGLLLIPSVSLAAPLTQEQANSLIAVVQSSPTTPASAFTNLITAFSNITIAQAESLISVVQQAPGVPATAFINLLIAFTVDVPVINQTQQTPIQEPVLGSTPVNNSIPPEPTAEVQITKELDVEISGNGVVASYKENGKKLPNIPITFSAPSGKFMFGGLNEPGSNAGKFLNPTTLPTSPEATGRLTNTAVVSYWPDTTISPTEKPVDDNNNWVSEEGGRYYPGVMITVSANGITKTVQGNRVYKVSK